MFIVCPVRMHVASYTIICTLDKIIMIFIALQPHSLRLHSSTLNFATTNSSTEGPALRPLHQVAYVERCSCPSNRIGGNCEGCADGYTTDPPFAGEFALCVRCYCSYQSTTCDSVSGVCSNCTGNTIGTQCEECMEGYDRAQSLTVLPCDRCAAAYTDNGSGLCTRESPCMHVLLWLPVGAVELSMSLEDSACKKSLKSCHLCMHCTVYLYV